MPRSGGKHSHLLTDPDVKRWHDNLAAGSVITAGVYLRGLGLFCELMKTTPKKILKDASTKTFRDGFVDFIRLMESQGKAGSYIERFRKVVLSWTSYNGINIQLKVNIRGKNESPTLSKERIPTRDELSKVLRMATPRGRVSIAMMAFSGLRPESLGDYMGTDGLRLGDFTEAKVHQSRVDFQKPPCIVIVRPNLSKARHRYFTLVGSEGLVYIQDYLRRRVEAGETLSEESPLLGFDPRGTRTNRFLRTMLVTRDIKEAMLKAGFDWRPYVLRSYADTQLTLAESKGLISHPYLQFLVGHKGDIEARYSTHKGVLPNEMVQDMKDAYRKSLRFLQTNAVGSSEDDQKAEFKKLVMTAVGFRAEDVAKMDAAAMSDAELQGLVKQKLLGVMQNNGVKQRVIAVSDVSSYIVNGWEFVSSLPKGKAIVKLPS
jgi:hypothetical protein